jgi:hypothetical protein
LVAVEKLFEAQTFLFGLFLIQNRYMTNITPFATKNTIVSYLLLITLVGFLALKLPPSSKSANENTLGLNIFQFQEKRNLIINSYLDSGMQLFDIKLELESSVIDKSNDLIARTRFESFGNVPTLVNLFFVITDSQGKEVYSDSSETTVETEKIVTQEFKKLNLKKGKYTLVLTTLYNTDVKDEFKQAFEVKGASVSEIISWTVLTLVAIGIGGSLIYKFVMYIKSKQN